MDNKIGKYQSIVNNINVLEEQEQTLQDNLNELVKEQYLFKDNTFYYANEVKILYKDIVEIKDKKDRLIGMATILKGRREARERAKMIRNKQTKQRKLLLKMA